MSDGCGARRISPSSSAAAPGLSRANPGGSRDADYGARSDRVIGHAPMQQGERTPGRLMKPAQEPPPIPSDWKRLLGVMQMGRVTDDLAQPFLERLADTTWLGQDDVDPPVAGRSVESASQQGAYYVMLNMLAEFGLISYRKGYAPTRPGFPATPYFWFRLTRFGSAFRHWPAALRRTFLAAVWLGRWEPWKRIVSTLRRMASAASLLVVVIKGWDRAWADVVLAIAVFVAIASSGRSRSTSLGETLDT